MPSRGPTHPPTYAGGVVTLDGGVGSVGPGRWWHRGEGGRRLPKVVTATVLAGVAAVLAGLGWALPVPGGSLIDPTLVVLGLGVVGAVAFWIAVGRPASSLAILVVTGLAAVWTFAFSLPASLAWNAGAAAQAHEALTRLVTSPKGAAGVPLRPCWTVTSGSVGKLPAPYRVCAVSSPEGHIVTFSTLGRPWRGLGFTDRDAAASFPDECARHLVGKWWMFISDPGGTGTCPIGYRFSGAG